MTDGVGRMIWQSLSSLLLLPSLIAMLIGFAAVGAMMDQCPDGNNCADARHVAALGLILATVGLILLVWLWRRRGP